MDELSEQAVAPDPITQFTGWYEDARAALGDDADAVVVATADANGAPSARVVLLRGFDARGFCFYTSYDSRKGDELRENPRAALVLYWPALHRQVRITGPVERVSDAESDAYWANRPAASRLSAWASQQSAPIASRGALENAVDAVTVRFGEADVPRPEFWGGYRVVPEVVEFWLHRDDRLHDRVQYRRTGGESDGAWEIERLQP
jgi:pyridoxamine 5'-phosphate oxidase